MSRRDDRRSAVEAKRDPVAVLHPLPDDAQADEPQHACPSCGADLAGWDGECWWCGEDDA